MTGLRATYRLQFREGMTFARAAELVPYLADLGVSHLYASPIFTAAPGSSHGYDVADHQELDPTLGGEAGFAQLAKALSDHGMGLLLDIVPNHMAVSTANHWWRDVLKRGRDSRYARHFDIDWSVPRLLLPVLGEPYGEALAEGKLALRFDAEAGELLFGYYDLALPVTPASYALLPEAGIPGEDLATALQAAEGRRRIETAVEAANADQELLHRLHEAQVWRLAYWRLAREALPYRRFFEIADLIGVRVEDPEVFAAVHALPLRLVREGSVDGLRIDHIDGLLDPEGYLDRLHEASGLDLVVVEKILGPGETLPRSWRCAGTTGYEVGQLITALQVEGRNRVRMTNAWTRFSGDDADFSRQVLGAKRRILTVNLAGELDALVRLAERIAAADRATRDFGRDALRIALVELASALPVYRTYIAAAGPSEADRAIIGQAAEKVDQAREVEDERVVAFLVSLLLEPTDAGPGEPADRRTFIGRFQQTTGPLMAKAVEDTVFYRFNRLIALNEVGAEPDDFGVEREAFHAAMQQRAAGSPLALSATATHDTKRGEDARARLAVLSEMPDEWAAGVQRWHETAADLREAAGGGGPGPRVEWLFFQAFAGAWPPDLSLDDAEGLETLCERLVDFMTKALREAKRRTSWTYRDEAFEAGVANYVRALFSPEQRGLLRDLQASVGRIEHAGMVNALAQLALKLTLPGVPDIYQGSELLDFSMVDPDNRRPVDFELRHRLLQEARQIDAAQAMGRWREGLPKLWLLDKLLDLRAREAALFEGGSYAPLEVEGENADHVVAFAREAAARRLVVAVPRLMLRHLDRERPSWISASFFSRTLLRLPGKSWTSVLTGQELRSEGGTLRASDLWKDYPVAVLSTPDAG